jgi:hypothetical protein
MDSGFGIAREFLNALIGLLRRPSNGDLLRAKGGRLEKQHAHRHPRQ